MVTASTARRFRSEDFIPTQTVCLGLVNQAPGKRVPPFPRDLGQKPGVYGVRGSNDPALFRLPEHVNQLHRGYRA